MQGCNGDVMMPELDHTLSEIIQQQITHAHIQTHTCMHNVCNSVHIYHGPGHSVGMLGHVVVCVYLRTCVCVHVH